jgi:uncharacterized protein (DUF362 family)
MIADVAITKTVPAYPESPYHPGLTYPEYPFKQQVSSLQPNHVYDAVRRALMLLGFDKSNFERKGWNPFGHLIKRGQHVVIKPNFVAENYPNEICCVTTHASVIRPILDYIYIATRGDIDVSICDAPLQKTDFKRVIYETGLDKVIKFYRDNGLMNIKLLDLRREVAISRKNDGFINSTIHLTGDPQGYTECVLDQDSELEPLFEEKNPKLEVGDYDAETTNSRHRRGHHRYLISNTVLRSDLFINVPKLKTHCKAGITVSMKNLIGINGSKAWIPHYRTGSWPKGDEFPGAVLPLIHSFFSKWSKKRSHIIYSVGKTLWKLYKRSILHASQTSRISEISSGFPTEGSWWGNDTIWRSVIDLNRIIIFANREGIIMETPQRKYLTLVDGVIAGDGEGPLHPTPRETGVIMLAQDPFCCDVVAATLMGFDHRKIRYLKTKVEPILVNNKTATDKISIASEDSNWSTLQNIAEHHLSFIPPTWWRGHIEI